MITERNIERAVQGVAVDARVSRLAPADRSRMAAALAIAGVPVTIGGSTEAAAAQG